jgi:cytochrome c peroxidase
MSARSIVIVLLAGAPLLAAQVVAPPAGDAGGRPALDARLRGRLLRLERPADPPADPTNRVADDPRAAELGQRLFFDARISRNGRVACATCHDPARAFTDGKSLAEGLGRAARNAPSLLDAAHARWLFWDGRSDSLWSQALKPLEHEDEMGGSRVDLARLLAVDAEYRAAYEALFGPLPDLADVKRFPVGAKPAEAESLEELPSFARAWLDMRPEDRRTIDGIFANAGKALAAYERKLAPRGSPFDAFVQAVRANDDAAAARYPDAALRGFALFHGRGNCRTCHGGPFLSDGEFHNIGIPALDRRPSRDPGRHGGIAALQGDPFNAHGPHSDAREGERALEIGRLVQSTELWGAYKTPSLRNVARTAPYMHQGQMATLRDVLEYYSTLEGAVPAGHHGETVLQPLNLTDGEIEDLLAFIESLTDPPLPDTLVRAP